MWNIFIIICFLKIRLVSIIACSLCSLCQIQCFQSYIVAHFIIGMALIWEKLSIAIKSPGWWLQKLHTEIKVVLDRICLAYFSSVSEGPVLAEGNKGNKLSGFFIYSIFFLAWRRQFILCPIPLETARYGNLKMKKVPRRVSCLDSQSFGGSFNHVSVGDVSPLADLKVPYLPPALASPPLQICIDPLALNQ